MKKRISWLLVGVMVFAFGSGVVARDVIEEIKAQIRRDFVVKIDGVEKEFHNANGERVYPVLYEGTTYLPLRSIGEIMGKTVYWYEKDKRIEIVDEDKTNTTVTDADVIVTNGNGNNNGKKEDNKVKEEKVYDETGLIGKDKAKEIALAKAGFKEEEVSFIKVELDKEKDILEYEVEFKKDGKEYNADIKADDGAIIKWEVEIDD